MEIARTYSDQYGRYSLLVPSTYTNNLPSSSGMSPNMLITCMNDPGPTAIGGAGLVEDPFYNPSYSQFCYTLQYLPGVTNLPGYTCCSRGGIYGPKPEHIKLQ